MDESEETENHMSSGPSSPEVRAKVRACQKHASDLLRSAEVLREREKLPHIAYHLATLALEELGKATLFIADSIGAPGDARAGTLLKHGDDHVRKLFWALWGPPIWKDVITKEQVESFKELASTIHQRRLAGIYVPISIEETQRPEDVIDDAECKRLISILRASLEAAQRQEFKQLTPKESDDLNWFLSVRGDSEKLTFIFSGSSLKKLGELGHTRAWLAWLRETFDTAQAEAKALAERELKRRDGEGEEEKPKWKVRLRLYTNSHSLREQPLVDWNSKMQLFKLTVGNKKEGELIVDMFLPKAALLPALWFAGWGLARSFAVALNIGTRGFFWWYVPKHVSRFYDQITDLETRSECIVERSPILKIDWGNEVLSKQQLLNVAVCLIEIVRLAENERMTLDRYAEGLTMMSKTDIHLQLERNAFGAFYFSLKEATRLFGEWDGESEFRPIFQRILARYFDSEEDRNKYQSLALASENGALEQLVTLEEVGVMKLIVDSHLQEKFWERVKDRKRSDERDQA